MNLITLGFSTRVAEKNSSNHFQPRRGGHFSSYAINTYDPGFSPCPVRPGKSCAAPPINKELGAPFAMGAAACAEMRRRRHEHLERLYKRASSTRTGEVPEVCKQNPQSTECNRAMEELRKASGQKHISDACLEDFPDRLDVHVNIKRSPNGKASDLSEGGVFASGTGGSPSASPPNVHYTMASDGSPDISAKLSPQGAQRPSKRPQPNTGVGPKTDTKTKSRNNPISSPRQACPGNQTPASPRSSKRQQKSTYPSQQSTAELPQTKNQQTETTGPAGKRKGSRNICERPKITVSHKTVGGRDSKTGGKGNGGSGETVLPLNCRQKNGKAYYSSQKIAAPWGSVGIDFTAGNRYGQPGGKFYDPLCYMDTPNLGDSNAANTLQQGMPSFPPNFMPMSPPPPPQSMPQQMMADPMYFSPQMMQFAQPICPPMQQPFSSLFFQPQFQHQQFPQQNAAPTPQQFQQTIRSETPHAPSPKKLDGIQSQPSVDNQTTVDSFVVRPNQMPPNIPIGATNGHSIYLPDQKAPPMGKPGRVSAFVGPDGRELSVRRMSHMPSMLMQHRRTRPSKAIDTSFSVIRTRNCAMPSRNAGMKEIRLIPQATTFSTNLTIPQPASELGHAEAILAACENAARNEREVAANEALQTRMMKLHGHQPDDRKSGI